MSIEKIDVVFRGYIRPPHPESDGTMRYSLFAHVSVDGKVMVSSDYHGDQFDVALQSDPQQTMIDAYKAAITKLAADKCALINYIVASSFVDDLPRDVRDIVVIAMEEDGNDNGVVNEL